MKNKIFILFFILSFGKNSKAQNLVPNPSFEIYTSCPDGNSYWPNEVNLATPWYNPTKFSPDYYDSCFASVSTVGVPYNFTGYQYAHTGHAYVGCCMYGSSSGYPSIREYVQVQLLDSLTQNRKYCVNFYVDLSLGNPPPYGYAITEIGLLFSNNAIIQTNYNYLNYSAQVTSPVGIFITDTANWIQISGTYTALGGEKFITIGNFKNDSATDTLSYAAYGQQKGAYYYIDDVSITECTNGINELQNNRVELKIYPNPNNGSMMLDYNLKNDAHLEITDITGNLLRTYILPATETTTQIQNNNLQSGMYLYRVISNNAVIKQGKIVIMK